MSVAPKVLLYAIRAQEIVAKLNLGVPTDTELLLGSSCAWLGARAETQSQFQGGPSQSRFLQQSLALYEINFTVPSPHPDGWQFLVNFSQISLPDPLSVAFQAALSGAAPLDNRGVRYEAFGGALNVLRARGLAAVSAGATLSLTLQLLNGAQNFPSVRIDTFVSDVDLNGGIATSNTSVPCTG